MALDAGAVAVDAVAVAAENDLVAGTAEVRTIMLLAGTEDVPEFVVQLLFLVMVDIAKALGRSGVFPIDR